jgi:hypothetical protein
MEEFEMNEKQLIKRTEQVVSDHEKAKTAYKAAKTDDERKQVMEEYPNYKHGYLPRTPARVMFDALKRHCEGGPELADPDFVAKCERVILATPDAAEICYHVANKIREGEPWPEAEPRIAESAWWAYMYASTILRGRFPAGEAAIRSEAFYSERYDRLLA